MAMLNNQRVSRSIHATCHIVTTWRQEKKERSERDRSERAVRSPGWKNAPEIRCRKGECRKGEPGKCGDIIEATSLEALFRFFFGGGLLPSGYFT